MNYSNFLTVRELTVLIKYNLENDIRFVIDDTLTFYEDETLLELMERTYTIETKKDSVGTIILSIDSYTTDFVSCYFSLYINGVYSSVGAKDVKLTGGLNIEWIYKKI